MIGVSQILYKPALGWRKRKISMFKFGCNACGETWEIGLPRTCKCPDYFSKAKPKKREWVGLTDDEKQEAMDWCVAYGVEAVVGWINDTLKEKNT